MPSTAASPAPGRPTSSLRATTRPMARRLGPAARTRCRLTARSRSSRPRSPADQPRRCRQRPAHPSSAAILCRGDRRRAARTSTRPPPAACTAATCARRHRVTEAPHADEWLPSSTRRPRLAEHASTDSRPARADRPRTTARPLHRARHRLLDRDAPNAPEAISDCLAHLLTVCVFADAAAHQPLGQVTRFPTALRTWRKDRSRLRMDSAISIAGLATELRSLFVCGRLVDPWDPRGADQQCDSCAARNLSAGSKPSKGHDPGRRPRRAPGFSRRRRTGTASAPATAPAPTVAAKPCRHLAGVGEVPRAEGSGLRFDRERLAGGGDRDAVDVPAAAIGQ